MNTKIRYLYRDADNYKVWNEAVIKGVLTGEQKSTILNCLYDDEYFIPRLVGLPETTFVSLGYSYDADVDHPYFELSADGIEDTNDAPTVEDMDTDKLTHDFIRAAANKWEEL